jgi:hypothetical protein
MNSARSITPIRRNIRRIFAFLLAAFFFIAGCDSPKTDLTPPSHFSIVNSGDITAGQPIAWQLNYRVGQKGLDPTGELLLRFPHAYYNTRPQNWLPHPDESNALPIRAKTASGTKLVATVSDKGWHAGTISIRAFDGLKPGDTVQIFLGKKTGEEPSFAPVYTTGSFTFLLLADTNGDGKFEQVPSANTVNIVADKPVTFEVIAPSQVQKDTAPNITVRLLDRFGNIATSDKKVSVEIRALYDAIGVHVVNIVFDPKEPGVKRVTGPLPLANDIHRLIAISSLSMEVVYSNPIRVYEKPIDTNWYWGDLQGHSDISDGTGSAAEYYAWAKGPGALDFASLTDHEWQIDQNEWNMLKQLCTEQNSPGNFVPLLSWEYSLGGHRVVYYKDCDSMPDAFFDGPKQFFDVEYNNAQIKAWPRSKTDEPLYDFGDPATLLRSLHDNNALVIPHTSATKDMGNDWDTHAPALTRLVEIYSAHGSSESEDTQRKVHGWAEKGTVQRALGRGYKIGFVAGGDSHDGKPGACIWGAYPGGLTALAAKELTRKSVWNALQNRQVYATTGARILLDFQINGQMMGQTIRSAPPLKIRIQANGTDTIARAEVVSNGQVIRSYVPRSRDFNTEFSDESLFGQAYYYLRIVQDDGQMAWSSPIWVTDTETPLVENLQAVASKDGARIFWDADIPDAGGHYSLYSRRGNDGGEKLDEYKKLADLKPLAGKNEYVHRFANPPGISAYYILRWVPSKGQAVRLGLVSSERQAKNELGALGVTIEYYVERPGLVDIIIYDLAEKVARRFEQKVQTPGLQKITWDGLDENGQRSAGLHQFEIHSDGYATQRKPIRFSPAID